MIKFKHLLFFAGICGLAALMLASPFTYLPAQMELIRDDSDYRASPSNEPLPTFIPQIGNNSNSEFPEVGPTFDPVSSPVVSPGPTDQPQIGNNSTPIPGVSPTATPTSSPVVSSSPSPSSIPSPTPTPRPQISESERLYWMALATNAWQYFQPGKGVDSKTGLHAARIDYPHFTDWDLGCYIQAIVEAGKLGILGNESAWGFDARVNKILSFLENRPLQSNRENYNWYSTNGLNYDEEYVETHQYAADTANLLVSLKNLETYRPDRADWASRINYVLNTRVNYERQKLDVEKLGGSVNVYDYFVARAFAAYWPQRFSAEANRILSNILNAETVVWHGVTLPKAKLSSEPLLLTVFGFPNDANVMALARQIYLAHEAYYLSNGKYVAFSEGSAFGFSRLYIWEWVSLPDGRTWVITTDEVTEAPSGAAPVIYLKAAISYDAIYNTEFTRKMTKTLLLYSWDGYASNGYFEGLRYIQGLLGESLQLVNIVSDKTNSMILSAARYAIENP